MDARGRSPSAGQTNNHIRHSTSASPHPSPLTTSFDGSLGSASLQNNQSAYATGLNVTSGPFSDPTFTSDYSPQAQFGLGPAYPGYSDQSQQQTQSNVSNHTFLQSQGLQNTNGINGDAFPAFDTTYDPSLDPSVLDSFDTSQLDLLSQQSGNINTNNQNLDPMAAMTQSHSPTPPHLFTDQGSRPSGSPSPHASPSFQQASYGQLGQVNRPRINSESLDPSSARYPQGGSNEWQHMGAYRSHQRTPSDNHSDMSSNHAASPNMPTMDSFEHSSPMLDPSSQDPSFGSGLGFENFNLNEQQQQFYSPGHSPGHSPHLMPQPQQILPPFTAENNFGLNATMNGHFNPQQNGGLDLFPSMGQDFSAAVSSEDQSPSGMADHMSPPEINIDFAPPSRVPTENMGVEKSADALSPPVRSK